MGGQGDQAAECGKAGQAKQSQWQVRHVSQATGGGVASGLATTACQWPVGAWIPKKHTSEAVQERRIQEVSKYRWAGFLLNFEVSK